MIGLQKAPLVSVYTCVYNGEKTIHRVFSSVNNLNYPNIEHIIVNDGSTDKTEQLVNEYITTAKFPVKYFKQKNGGKHSALNVCWANATGDFMIQLDADDELLPNSIDFLVNTYFSIPEEVRDVYWCVHGRCVTQHGDFVGDPYPKGINLSDWVESQKIAGNYNGEKIGLQVTKYLSRFRFPSVVGAHYLPEDIIWRQINSQYGTWYTNEVCRIYYVNEGESLSAHRTKRYQFGSLAYYYKWKILHPDFYSLSKTDLIRDLLLYSFCFSISSKKYRKHNGYLKDYSKLAQKIFLLSAFLPVWLVSILYRIIKKIK